MTRRIKALLVLVCILALTAGSVPAQDERVPGQGFIKAHSSIIPAPGKHRGTPGSHPAYTPALSPGMSPLRQPAPRATVGASPVIGLLGYHASLQQSGLYSPCGIGVSYRGDRIYITQSDDCDVELLYNKEYKTYVHLGWDPGPIRNRGNLYCTVTDNGYSDIYRVGPGGYDEWIGWAYDGCDYDYISAIDVDRATGDVYFMVNCDYWEWTALYVLPAKDFGGEAYIVDSWYDDPCWGLAVKGNKIYSTSYYDGSVWVCDKSGDNWEEIIFGFEGPCDLGFDKLGNLFVAEWDGGSVARVRAGSTNVARLAVGLDSPYYLELDGQGRVFVSDMHAGNIWMFWK